MYRSARKAKNITHGKALYGGSFKMKDTTINANDSSLYIGHTKNYIFFYDDKRDSTLIFPINKLEEFGIKNYVPDKADSLENQKQCRKN